MGEMELIAIRVGIDYRVEKRNGEFIVEFSFDGFDEMDPITGRGRARIVGNELSGMLFIHQGDESAFVARRQAGSNKGAPGGGHRGGRAKPTTVRHGDG
jgi:hypothetical protein